MPVSIGSATDAFSTLQSLLQSAANSAGNLAGIGPVGDFLADAAKGVAQGNGPAPGAQAFGKAPPPFPDGTMAALIALKGQDGNGTGGAQGLFGKLDSDGNGSISQSEFENALTPSGVDKSNADALFATLDRNGDGAIDQGELTSATRRGHGHHHHHHMNADAAGAPAGQGTAQANPTSLIEQLMKMQTQLAGEQGATVSAVA